MQPLAAHTADASLAHVQMQRCFPHIWRRATLDLFIDLAVCLLLPAADKSLAARPAHSLSRVGPRARRVPTHAQQQRQHSP